MKFAGKPLMLMILDGWGMSTAKKGDALALANLPNFKRLWHNYPHTTLGASGSYVGLPDGQMGDSEVGHMNIGSGRVIYQEITRINKAIEDGSFSDNLAFSDAIEQAKRNGGALHIYGLISDGGIHSHINHLLALLRVAKEQDMRDVYVHCFTDGRDTPARSALHYVEMIEQEMARLGLGKIASLVGRFYAMDRDKRWERVEKAYHLMVYGEGLHFRSARAAIEDSYARNVSDEFIEPSVIVDENDQPLAKIRTGDSVIFFNYRSDRAREISHAISDAHFNFFDRGPEPPRVHYVCMTEYESNLKAPIAFPPMQTANTLGKVLSRNGLRQLRIAETEKYAHVTFFFNGGVEKMDIGEDRVMIPSPNVATYDMQPEMNCQAVTRAVVDRIRSGIYDVIVLNFANPDMVGHTGNLEATITALEAVDACIGQIEATMRLAHGTLLITADHGNVEQMLDADGSPHTAHTTNLVPFILVDDNLKQATLHPGRLEDIAPTILQLLDIKKPKEMTGESLIESGINNYSQMSFAF